NAWQPEWRRRVPSLHVSDEAGRHQVVRLVRNRQRRYKAKPHSNCKARRLASPESFRPFRRTSKVPRSVLGANVQHHSNHTSGIYSAGQTPLLEGWSHVTWIEKYATCP